MTSNSPRPRLLIVVTLAEAGGAQTFVGNLMRQLAGSYQVDVAANGAEGALARACEEAEIPFHHLATLVRDPAPVRDAAAIPALRRLAARLRPDVVQVNSSKAGVLVRLALAGTGIPVVFTAHGWAFSGRGGTGGQLWAGIERSVAPLAAAIVCVSAHDLALARARRVGRAATLHLIHNGIDVGAPVPARRWPDSPLVACTARLAAPKDVTLLCEALARPEGTPWRALVIGDGPDEPTIRARVADLGLADRVTLAGERDDVAALLATADAFALPTRWEGLPYSILEAMAAGLPVVATAVGGIPELVRDGTTGILVPRGDAAALAAALGRLAAAPEAAQAMGAAGRNRAEAAFSVERMAARYDHLFRDLIEQPVSAAALRA